MEWINWFSLLEEHRFLHCAGWDHRHWQDQHSQHLHWQWSQSWGRCTICYRNNSVSGGQDPCWGTKVDWQSRKVDFFNVFLVWFKILQDGLILKEDLIIWSSKIFCATCRSTIATMWRQWSGASCPRLEWMLIYRPRQSLSACSHRMMKKLRRMKQERSGTMSSLFVREKWDF